MGYGELKDKRDEWIAKVRELELQIGAMRELLSQYQSNIHLFKHDANMAPMDCQIEPCPKTTKLILTEKRSDLVLKCDIRKMCKGSNGHAGPCR